MTTYAVGDIQGCLQPLKCLLQTVDFNPGKDTLWVCGDLVNRGPDSLETLRFLYKMRDSVVAVFGNHDLHLLAVARDKRGPKPKDTLAPVLTAPDRDELLAWLRGFKLIHCDPQLGYAMVHAGIPPIWSLAEALRYSAEVEAVIQGDQFHTFLEHMYGNTPDCWDSELTDPERWRVITNYFTRMRFCTAQGRLELTGKLGPENAPPGFRPWFSFPLPAVDDVKLVFGHWASLKGQTNHPRVFGLDTGCVWGGQLSLLCLETEQWHRCDC